MEEFYYGIFSERSRNLTDTGYKIEVRILKEVEYVGDSFYTGCKQTCFDRVGRNSQSAKQRIGKSRDAGIAQFTGEDDEVMNSISK